MFEATRQSFYHNYYLENKINGSSVDVRAQWDKLLNAYNSGRIQGTFFFFTQTITIKKNSRLVFRKLNPRIQRFIFCVYFSPFRKIDGIIL
jgi:hypothetical protein